MQSMISEITMNGIRSLSKWCREIGVNPITAWRWRKSGWLKTVNIAGRQYVTDEAIAEFQRRAESGEFSKEHRVPGKRESKFRTSDITIEEALRDLRKRGDVK